MTRLVVDLGVADITNPVAVTAKAAGTWFGVFFRSTIPVPHETARSCTAGASSSRTGLKPELIEVNMTQKYKKQLPTASRPVWASALRPSW
jgi:hypothetical protein